MMRFIAIMGVVVVSLTGCEGTKPISEMGYTERLELASEIVARCAAAGAKPNSPEMMICAEAEIQAEDAGRAKSKRVAQGLAVVAGSVGQSMTAASRNNRPVTCNTTPGYGGTSSTTCN